MRAGHRTRTQFSEALGISDRTIGNLERGQPVGANTLAEVAIKLGWTPDSPDNILDDGGEPTPLDATGPTRQSPPANTATRADDHPPSRATPEEIILTLQRAAQRDRELGRGGTLFWAAWDLAAEVNHPRADTPHAAARGDRSA